MRVSQTSNWLLSWQNKKRSIRSKDWSWLNSQKKSFLCSNLLGESGIEHGFFTNHWNTHSPVEITKNLNSFLTIHDVTQVHGNIILEASKSYNERKLEADGLISDEKGQSLWIYTADCLPVLFADTQEGHVAAIHAGWRGIKNGILIKAINKFEDLGIKKSSLIIALGPSITKEKYQIDISVAMDIAKSINMEVDHFHFHPDNPNPEQFINKIFSHENIHGKLFLDIKEAAKRQLMLSGLIKSQIAVSPYCTFSDEDLFYSWRRDHIRRSQWSYIASGMRK